MWRRDQCATLRKRERAASSPRRRRRRHTRARCCCPTDSHGLVAPRHIIAIAVAVLCNAAPIAPRRTEIISSDAISPAATIHLHAAEHPSPTEARDTCRDTVRPAMQRDRLATRCKYAVAHAAVAQRNALVGFATCESICGPSSRLASEISELACESPSSLANPWRLVVYVEAITPTDPVA